MEQRIPLSVFMHFVIGIRTDADQIVETKTVRDFALVAQSIYIPAHSDGLPGRTSFVCIPTRFANNPALVNTYILRNLENEVETRNFGT